MNFVKLYDMPCGDHQLLVRLTSAEEKTGLSFSTYVESVGIIETVHAFDDPADTLEAFGMVTETVARKVVAEALNDAREQI